MRYLLLGPVEVDTDQGRQEITAPKWKALLTCLLLHRDQVVPMAVIIDALWGENPPNGARNLVSIYVLRLRRLLADDAAQVLVTRSAGFQLRADPLDTDIGVFEAKIRDAARALADGYPDQAAGLYDTALALWRGPALADVPPSPRVLAEAARLQELYLTAVEQRIAARLACGRGGGAVAELRQLVAEHPLRESLWVLLMRGLASAGRQAEALESYAEARARIRDELGTDPGKQLQATFHAILRAHTTARGAPARPAESRTRPEPPQCQLPYDVADFTGRKAECDQLLDALARAEYGRGVVLVTVAGAPGIGKTALALHVAHRARTLFAHGQFFAHLASSSDRPRSAGDVLAEWLSCMGTPASAIPQGTAERSALFRSRTAGRRVLIMLDDARDAEQIRPLLPGTAGSAAVITGRGRLAVPGAVSLVVDPLPPADATDLLVRIAGPDRMAREPHAGERLVRCCDGLPLALRVVGTRLAVRPDLSVTELADRLARHRGCLDELAVGDLAVRASIASSYNALTRDEQRAFRRLGLLQRGDFSESALGALFGLADPRAVAEALVDRCLIMPHGRDALGRPTYHLHPLTRAFARERLEEEALLERGRIRSARLRTPAGNGRETTRKHCTSVISASNFRVA